MTELLPLEADNVLRCNKGAKPMTERNFRLIESDREDTMYIVYDEPLAGACVAGVAILPTEYTPGAICFHEIPKRLFDIEDGPNVEPMGAWLPEDLMEMAGVIQAKFDEETSQ